MLASATRIAASETHRQTNRARAGRRRTRTACVRPALKETSILPGGQARSGPPWRAWRNTAYAGGPRRRAAFPQALLELVDELAEPLSRLRLRSPGRFCRLGGLQLFDCAALPVVELEQRLEGALERPELWPR